MEKNAVLLLHLLAPETLCTWQEDLHLYEEQDGCLVIVDKPHKANFYHAF